MYKQISVLLFYIFVTTAIYAQLPKENARLNYRIIGFSYPVKEQSGNTKLEIATGNYYSEYSFKKNIIKSLPARKNEMIVEVPSFGASYTWRTVHTVENKKIIKGRLYHFSVATVPAVDTDKVRLRIIKDAEKYKDAYVFLDGNKAMYDMAGKPIWYLPDIDGNKSETAIVRDMKLSPQGTITMLLNDHAYETDISGNILWQGPNNKNITRQNEIEAYHHEFTRLANGYYMILGNELASRKLKVPLPVRDSSIHIHSRNRPAPDTNSRFYNKPGYTKKPFGTVIEYDEKGNIVWQWKSVDYFKDADYYSINPVNGMDMLTVHENSFYFDEKDSIIYVGFRDISRIVKLRYPTGNVLATYGEIYKKDTPQKGNPLFCGQHSCRRSEKGYLYVFNNGCDMSAPPKVTMMRESSSGDLEKVWEYACPDENMRRQAPLGTYELTTGGNAIELPGNAMFISTTTKYSRLLIVDHDKKTLWSALPEKWIPSEKKWMVIPQYRASIINTRKELESLIWNAETKQ